MLKKHSLMLYFSLTYILSWICWSSKLISARGIINNTSINKIYGFGPIMPIIVALLVTLIIDGNKGIREIFSKFRLTSFKLRWYIISLFLVPVLCICTSLILAIFKNEHIIISSFFAWNKFFMFLPYFIVFSFFEEVAWRGFALPKLLKKFSALKSSIILGIIWGVWHLPKLLAENIRDISSILIFICFTTILSIFITWIFNNTNKSLIPIIIAHAATNASIGASSIIIGNNLFFNIFIIISLIFIIFVIYIYGSENLGNSSCSGNGLDNHGRV